MKKYGSKIVVSFLLVILGIQGISESGSIPIFTNCQIVKAGNLDNISVIPDITFGDNLYETIDVTIKNLLPNSFYNFELIDATDNRSKNSNSSILNVTTTQNTEVQKRIYFHRTYFENNHEYYVKYVNVSTQYASISNVFKVTFANRSSVFSRIDEQRFNGQHTKICSFDISNIADGICNIQCKEYGSNQVISSSQMTKEPAQDLNVDYLLDFSKLKDDGLYYYEVCDSARNSYKSNVFRTYRDSGKKMWSENNTIYEDGNYVYIKTTVHRLLPNDKYALQLDCVNGYSYYVVYETPLWTADSEGKTVTMKVPKSSFVNGVRYGLCLVYLSSNYAPTGYHNFVYPDDVTSAPSDVPTAVTNGPSNPEIVVSNVPSQPTPPVASGRPSETGQPTDPSEAPTISATPTFTPEPKPMSEKENFPSLESLKGYVNSRKSEFKIQNASSFTKIEYKLVKKGQREDKCPWVEAHDGMIQLKGEGKYYLVVKATNTKDATKYKTKSKVFTLDTVKPTIKKTYSKKAGYVLVIKDSSTGIKSVKVNGKNVVAIKNLKSKSVKIKVRKGQKVVVSDKAGNKVNYVVR